MNRTCSISRSGVIGSGGRPPARPVLGVGGAAVAAFAAVVLAGCQTTPARTGWNGYQDDLERRVRCKRYRVR